MKTNTHVFTSVMYSSMNIVDILTIAPTIALFTLFAVYRDNVLCFWGCNPTFQNVSSTAFHVGSRAILKSQAILSEVDSIVLTLVNDLYNSIPQREVLFSLIVKRAEGFVSRILTLNATQIIITVYILWILMSGIFLYTNIRHERRVRFQPNEDAPVKLQFKPRRPITRSMTRVSMPNA